MAPQAHPPAKGMFILLIDLFMHVRLFDDPTNEWVSSGQQSLKFNILKIAMAGRAQRLSYSSCRRIQNPFSLRPRGARSSH
jgi:hypothetical protein